MQVFISHSSKEANTATDICSMIENNGDSCFIAPRDIRSGYEYAEEIINGIDSSNAMILLLSAESNKSPHVLREVERAVSKSIPIIVYQLEEVELTKSMEYFLMTHQWIGNKSKRRTEILSCLDQIRYKEMKEDLHLANDYSKSGKSVANSENVINKNNRAVNNRNDSKKIKNNKKNSDNDKKWIPWVIGAGVLVFIFVILLCIVISGNRGNNNSTGNETTSKNEISNNLNSGDIDSDDKDDTESKLPDVKLGDEITIGKYDGEEIVWRVLKITDDGKAILISDKILCMKPFDVAESGEYNYDGADYYWDYNWSINPNYELEAMVRGNNLWYLSNIRTWLNSSDEVVEYSDQEPSDQATSDLANGYHTEAGFLNGFTEEELEMLVETEISTDGGSLGGGVTVKSDDRVFLLSLDELKWFEDADISIYAEPTNEAIENDETNSYEIYSLDYNVDTYFWMLRDPVEETGSMIYMVSNGASQAELGECIAGVGNFGIRPAITIDLTKLEL